MDKMLVKFIDEGKREHEEMEILIREFRTTNELLLKEQSNLLSKLKIEIHELSRVMNDALFSKLEVKGVTTIGGKMASGVTYNNEISRANEPSRLQHDKLEKPQKENKGVKNISNAHIYSVSANEIDEKKTELKDLPSHLEYEYLHNNESFLVIISSKLSEKEKRLLLHVLEKHRGAITWKMSDIKGISSLFCTHKIPMEDNFKPVIQPQRGLNPKVQDVIKNEIIKLLNSGIIYPISDSSWVSRIHVVPRKGWMTVVFNDNNELVPSRTLHNGEFALTILYLMMPQGSFPSSIY
nr:putative reverse transcriptase domain-containing protein [Tanacetum cinerariifolium]